ncbi:hypothetical protein [Streptomyces sp. NPDC096311]|uniref:hypothetical protein n=1 Tax=Streptomyces sp. NPDC096311 TaxID=3366083 RepID=UPI0037FFD5FC
MDRPIATVTPQQRPVVPGQRPPAARPGQPRTIRKVLWWAACLVCGGLVGLGLAAVGTLRGRTPSRFRMGVIAAGAVAQLVCAGSFAVLDGGGDFRPCPRRELATEDKGKLRCCICLSVVTTPTVGMRGISPARGLP